MRFESAGTFAAMVRATSATSKVKRIVYMAEYLQDYYCAAVPANFSWKAWRLTHLYTTKTDASMCRVSWTRGARGEGRGGLVLFHYGSRRRMKCGERKEEWRDDLSFSVAALFGMVGSVNIEGAAIVMLSSCWMLWIVKVMMIARPDESEKHEVAEPETESDATLEMPGNNGIKSNEIIPWRPQILC